MIGASIIQKIEQIASRDITWKLAKGRISLLSWYDYYIWQTRIT